MTDDPTTDPADETTDDTEDTGPHTRPFLDVLRDLEKGRLVDELTDRLPEVVAAAKDTGKAGELILRIKIKPHAKNDDVLLVESSVVAKVPQADRKPSLMYADGDANLVRQDPNQMALPGVGAGGPKLVKTEKTKTRRTGS